jgi:hypothetical protein
VPEEGRLLGVGVPSLRWYGQKSQLSDFPCKPLLGNVCAGWTKEGRL